MNSKRGVATDFLPARDAEGFAILEQSRYTVRLDSGACYKVKPGSVRAEPVASSSARPKAKGKGKKGVKKRQ